MPTNTAESSVKCPSCASGFDTATGMKIHHSQAHNRTLDRDFRDEILYFERNHAGSSVLLTVFEDATDQSNTLYGTLSGSNGDMLLDSGDQTWEVLWLGGASPAGYYVHAEDPTSDPIGRVVRLQLVEELRVEATETGLKTVFDGISDVSEIVSAE